MGTEEIKSLDEVVDDLVANGKDVPTSAFEYYAGAFIDNLRIFADDQKKKKIKYGVPASLFKALIEANKAAFSKFEEDSGNNYAEMLADMTEDQRRFLEAILKR